MTEPSEHGADLDPQGLWQGQQKEPDPMITLADIHLKARKFESRIQLRNAVEYVACGVVMVGFVQPLVFGPNWMIRAGAALVMLGTIYVGWQMHRRLSVEATPSAGESLIDSYRRQLIRQRDAIRSIASWYLAPFIPGMALMLVGMWFRAPKPGVPIERVHASLVIVTVIEVAALFAIWLLNQRGARQLQKKIDAL